ncbi:hypothetical protein BLA28_13110 [Eisenbergiella tayi]|nr:hypothetical protein BLA28_13110 [Eisenbergiella tayi]
MQNNLSLSIDIGGTSAKYAYVLFLYKVRGGEGEGPFLAGVFVDQRGGCSRVGSGVSAQNS